jgi:phospholipid/cholesterol/gamma-HCH transport system substrate-binding protein
MEENALSRRTEIAVGTTVLAALFIMGAGIIWLKDYGGRGHKTVWHVVFPQTGGLAKSDEVLVNGVRKGRVEKLELRGDKVLVELALDSDVRLTSESKVAVRNVGMMGEKVIAVDYRLGGAPLSPRDTIPGIYELGVGEVMAQLGETIDEISGLTAELRNVGDELTKEGHLRETIINFRETSEHLRTMVVENRGTLRTTLANFSAAAKTARELTADRETELRRSLDRFQVAADNMARLSTRLDSLRASIQTITSKVESGQGTLGKLINDDKLYADVNTSVKSLRTLIEDIKRNPRKYLKISVF